MNEFPDTPNTNSPASIPTPMVYEDEDYRWEYKHMTKDLSKDNALTEDEVNKLGQDHWELAGTFAYDGIAHYYFKRIKK